MHLPEHTPSGAPAASSDQSDDSGLGLKVERRSKDWRVVWNKNAAVNATGGRLSIIDGTIRKNFDLDHEELRKGNILHSPVTDDVALRLEIVIASAAPITESVRLVAGEAPGRSAVPRRSPRVPKSDQSGPSRVARSDAAWVSSSGVFNETHGQRTPVVRSLLRTAHTNRVPGLCRNRISRKNTATSSRRNSSQSGAPFIRKARGKASFREALNRTSALARRAKCMT